MPEVQQVVKIEVEQFGGQNTAINPARLPPSAQTLAQNAVMRQINTIGQRDGSVPVTTAALGALIRYIVSYRSTPTQSDMLATSGDKLYKYNGTDTLTPQTMTNVLVTADINSVAVTNISLASFLFIVDTGSMKKYTAGSPGTVVNITPAADDTLPLPPNEMTAINALNMKYCWIYKGQIFVSGGNDTVFYSKPFIYDYFPSVQFERFVRENDYINGNGLQFENAMFLPMRKGWGYLTGKNLDDIQGNLFLNTVNGVIAPKSVQIVTYPDGQQTIVYLSDDGVYEIFISAVLGNDKTYATKSIMTNKIDFQAIGLTDVEKAAAVSFYDPVQSQYILAFVQGSNNYALVYDTRNAEWYQWKNIKANSIERQADTLYYAGSEGHLRVFDQDLNSDWDQVAKTTGTPIHFRDVGPLISFEFSGYESYLDYYLLEAQQHNVTSTLDVYIVYGRDMASYPNALVNQIFTWDVGEWDLSQWANEYYSVDLNQAKQIILKKKGRYFQRIWENNRDEPALLYRETYTGRLSGR